MTHVGDMSTNEKGTETTVAVEALTNGRTAVFRVRSYGSKPWMTKVITRHGWHEDTQAFFESPEAALADLRQRKVRDRRVEAARVAVS